MRYIVAQMMIDRDGVLADSLDCNALVFCDTPRDVEEAINGCDEWSVFEVVDGKPVRRAVRYNGNAFEIV